MEWDRAERLWQAAKWTQALHREVSYHDNVVQGRVFAHMARSWNWSTYRHDLWG